MYICLCNAVTDSQIKSAIEEGHESLRSLKRELCIGKQCGKCIPDVMNILSESIASQEAYYEIA